MDYARSFAVSAAGMSAERTRVEVASLNIANAHTVQAPGTTGYQPLRAVANASFTALVGESGPGGPGPGVPTVTIEASTAAPRLVHEPGHPYADARGFVAYPAVDAATEMVILMAATRAYEANVAAMNTARSLALKTLEIGRSS